MRHEGFLEFLHAMRMAQLKLLTARLPRLLYLQHFPANDWSCYYPQE